MPNGYEKVQEWSRYINALTVVLHRGREISLLESLQEGVCQCEIQSLVQLHGLIHENGSREFLDEFRARLFWSIWIDQAVSGALDAEILPGFAARFPFPKLLSHPGPSLVCPAGWLLHEWEWVEDPAEHKEVLLKTKGFLWQLFDLDFEFSQVQKDAIVARLRQDVADQNASFSRFPYLL